MLLASDMSGYEEATRAHAVACALFPLFKQNHKLATKMLFHVDPYETEWPGSQHDLQARFIVYHAVRAMCFADIGEYLNALVGVAQLHQPRPDSQYLLRQRVAENLTKNEMFEFLRTFTVNEFRLIGL